MRQEPPACPEVYRARAADILYFLPIGTNKVLSYRDEFVDLRCYCRRQRQDVSFSYRSFGQNAAMLQQPDDMKPTLVRRPQLHPTASPSTCHGYQRRSSARRAQSIPTCLLFSGPVANCRLPRTSCDGSANMSRKSRKRVAPKETR